MTSRTSDCVPTQSPVAALARGCGADAWGDEWLGVWKGASPRERGRRRAALEGRPSARSIPAHAGPTTPGPAAGTPASEHPRERGADGSDRGDATTTAGASTRVRGRLPDRDHDYRDVRSIPARAGPTSAPASSADHTGEHPRACGADRCRYPPPPSRRGASPRVRGRPVRGVGRGRRHRSIPAGAGPTCSSP